MAFYNPMQWSSKIQRNVAMVTMIITSLILFGFLGSYNFDKVFFNQPWINLGNIIGVILVFTTFNMYNKKI